MRTIIVMLLALSLSVPALGGTLKVEKKGLVPAFVWLDGQPQGKVKKKKPLSIVVEDGVHELWFAIEKGGTVTSCHGLVEVKGSATVKTTGLKCEGLSPGFPDSGSFFRGASISFQVNGGVSAWMSVDGSQPLSLPFMPFMLNLTPGTHNVVMYADSMMDEVWSQGTVTLKTGDTVAVTCTSAGCLGFDQPPQPVPGFRIEVNIDGGTGSVNVQVGGDAPSVFGSSTQEAPPSGGGDFSCCINGSYYSCPNAAAVDKCSGAQMRCQVGCSMEDFDCFERCLRDYPMDPSDCTPATGSCD